MAWYVWVVLTIALVGAAWLWSCLYRDTDVVSCIGCGKCAATGECVYVKERKKGAADCGKESKSRRAVLTNPIKTV
jgi:hypothetical protein